MGIARCVQGPEDEDDPLLCKNGLLNPVDSVHLACHGILTIGGNVLYECWKDGPENVVNARSQNSMSCSNYILQSLCKLHDWQNKSEAVNREFQSKQNQLRAHCLKAMETDEVVLEEFLQNITEKLETNDDSSTSVKNILEDERSPRVDDLYHRLCRDAPFDSMLEEFRHTYLNNTLGNEMLRESRFEGVIELLAEFKELSLIHSAIRRDLAATGIKNGHEVEVIKNRNKLMQDIIERLHVILGDEYPHTWREAEDFVDLLNSANTLCTPAQRSQARASRRRRSSQTIRRGSTRRRLDRRKSQGQGDLDASLRGDSRILPTSPSGKSTSFRKQTPPSLVKRISAIGDALISSTEATSSTPHQSDVVDKRKAEVSVSSVTMSRDGASSTLRSAEESGKSIAERDETDRYQSADASMPMKAGIEEERESTPYSMTSFDEVTSTHMWSRRPTRFRGA